jgi:hypothetical protein
VTAKTDNHSIATKLALRRALLPKHKPLDVLDAFSGSEVIWSILRAEYKVTDYTSLDLKAKRGRLKLDAMRYLQRMDWVHDVIDLDCYGSPWPYFDCVLSRKLDCIVFLTIGRGAGEGSRFNAQCASGLLSCGVTFKIPNQLGCLISRTVTEYSLAKTLQTHTVKRCVQAESGNAKYIGLEIKTK